jgi:signal transduction histidine kinase
MKSVRKRTTAARSHPGPLLDSIMTHSTDGIIVLDPAERVRDCNPAAARLCGRTLSEIVGLEWTSLGLEPARVESGAPQGAESGAATATAHERALATRWESHDVRDAAGRVLATIKLTTHSADPAAEAAAEARERALGNALRALRSSHEQLKAAQLQVVQAAKLESIGRLAAGVAHEVKNPLAVLLTGIQLLKRWSPEPRALEMLDELEASVRRANGVVVGLLDFARSTELRLEACDLEDVVAESVRLVRPEIDEREFRLVVVQENPVPRLRLDRTKIEQVLVNLMMNAMDACPENGELTVRTSLRPLTRSGHGVGFRKTDVLRVGQTVAVIEIEDNGSGVPANVLPRVFEPFYTTKPAGKGTGLGLAVCRMIAELHRGSVWLENRAEGGTRATLWLPAGEAQKGEPS